MRILLVIWLFHSLAFADDVWQESTLNNYKHSINTRFERMNNNGSDKAKNICVAIEPTDGLKEKLNAKKNTDAETVEGIKAKRAYRREVHKQKVLCVSRYNNGREKIEMFSYFDGKKSYRVHCQLDDGDFVCHNRSKQRRYLPAKFTVLADSGNLVDRITKLGYRKFSDDGKLFRLRTDYVSSRQKAFLPWHSKEQPEFKDGKHLFNNTETIDGWRGLPTCASNADFSQKRAVCHDHFKGSKNYCPSGTTDQEVMICKLATKKGILIKQDDGNILRVVGCEYQSEAKHFYCSGKLDNEATPKVYYERYGVDLVEPIECLRKWNITARVESLTCVQQLIDKSCDSFAGDIANRCRGIVREEGCNFYKNEEHGQECPKLAELLSGLGCRATARYDDPCDFRHDDTSSSGGSTPVVQQPEEEVTLPVSEPGGQEEPVVDEREGVPAG